MDQAFNAHMVGYLMLVYDDQMEERMSKKMEGRNKYMATQKTIWKNAKFRTPTCVQNYAQSWAFTNLKYCPWTIEGLNQRRQIFTIMDSCFAGDQAYFDQLYGELERPDCRTQIAMYKWFMTRDLSNWNRNNPKLPVSTAMVETLVQSAPLIAKYMVDVHLRGVEERIFHCGQPLCNRHDHCSGLDH
eukprot:27870-Eustigmatos_ZCMA.PRE.1